MSLPYQVNQYYDDAYNTRRDIPDVNIDLLYEVWKQRSEEARDQADCELGIRYGKGNRETIDLFYAGASTRWVVFIHGGYWRMKNMTSGHFHYLAPSLLKAGWNVAFPEYGVSPDVTMHSIVDQVRRSIVFLAKQYSNQCEEIVLAGHSAGGHLTAMMFTKNWRTYGVASNLISGGISISGLLDLDPIAQTTMNQDLNLTHDDVLTLSPARLFPRVQAPLVLTVGGLESSEFHRQNEVLRGVPEWHSITNTPLSLNNYHHFNIVDLLGDMDSPMWTTLQRMQMMGH